MSVYALLTIIDSDRPNITPPLYRLDPEKIELRDPVGDHCRTDYIFKEFIYTKLDRKDSE